MTKQKINALLVITIILLVVLIGGSVAYYYYTIKAQPKSVACTQEAKLCPDGSSVGRTGPNCDFATCPISVNDWKNYINNEYGFSINFPDSWKGYSVVKSTWTGHLINNYATTYTGVEIIIKNPQTTASQTWQDIPIMVFTPDVWVMVSGNNPTVAVSAAPIGPGEIGENKNFVFATPPRWYGFTDNQGWQEAVDIVKTFKGF